MKLPWLSDFRLLILLGAVLVQSSLFVAWGQSSGDFVPSVWGGVRAGAEVSRFVFVPRVRQHFHFSPAFGAMVRLEVERFASLQVEANWSQIGWVEKYDDPKLGFTRTLTSVEVPILAHLYLGRRSLRLFLNAGPALGYYLSDRSYAVGETQLSERQRALRELPIKHRLSWGIVGGLGLSYAVAQRHRLELEPRFTYGFGDIWSSRRVDPYGQSSPMKVGLSLNYLLRF